MSKVQKAAHRQKKKKTTHTDTNTDTDTDTHTDSPGVPVETTCANRQDMGVWSKVTAHAQWTEDG